MLKNMKLGTRLALGFGFILVLMIVMIAASFVQMRDMNDNLKQIVKVNVYKMELCNQMSESIHIVTRVMRTIVLLPDTASMQREYKKIEDARAKYDAAFAALNKTKATAEGYEIRSKIREAQETSRSLNNKVIELGFANKQEDATKLLMEKAAPATQAWQDALEENVKLQDEKNKEDMNQAQDDYKSAITTMIIIGIFALLSAFLIAYFMTISITKPINQVVDALTEGSDQVAAASEQLSVASQQLAEGSSELASSIEETSSTLEESASMVQQNTENTRQAASLSAQAKTIADKGTSEMLEMTTAMSEIKKSSDQIAKIIKVIDEIAFQTNILALNAAVEAARAGDAGMGFAVVAEEVRSLAQRSAQAAKDTAGIIEQNIQLSNKGVNVADQVANSLAEITIQAKKVNELMDEIAAASAEQSQGIGQINKAIAQMDKVTQQNAANAEESAASSEELSSQAENMKVIVQELINLVNGYSGIDTLNTGYRRSLAKPKLTHSSSVLTTQRSRTPKLRAATDKQLAAKESRHTKIVNPQDVIPLEDDLRDF